MLLSAPEEFLARNDRARESRLACLRSLATGPSNRANFGPALVLPVLTKVIGMDSNAPSLAR
jgi:hypothetical protein